VLVVEEFHNILVEDKVLMLQVIKEIRKYGIAPTLITQNVKDFSRSEEGQMIFDNCSIKVLLRQGENDVEEVERLFDLSRNEKIFLKTCPVGKGYLVTDLYKIRFKVDCSEREYDILTTNPVDIMRRNKL
jgi:type IV secretory pathway VirB4 component